ncbi:MAG: pbp2 [Parachlamydiales bacterium]|nr:pbp2 [Parachlamydiales bacterium]
MIPPLHKSNRLLQIFLAAFLLIAFRIWHLAVIQREEKLQEAHKPQRRTIIQAAQRGSIVDRFGMPLAINRICYRASVYYNQFSQIPAAVWKTDEEGQRTKTYCRKEYIHNLSCMLGRELGMDPERIDDLIHAKASLFPHAPFIIQSNLTESQYYRLKALEREWIGLRAEIAQERFYPLGKTGAFAIGHLGAISQKEYLAIASELDSLQQMMAVGNEDDSLIQRYQELKEKAYTLNDLVGKAGIEKQYEETLRGFYGKKIYEIDQKGNCLHELPGSQPSVAGQTVVLSLSAELQQFCEKLLIQNEKARDHRSLGVDVQSKTRKSLKQPYIKGGAIVALDPNNGEVIALAGFPRFDPNDFVTSSNRDQKFPRIRRWQEGDGYIGELWDGKASFFREGITRDEEPMLSWETYLLSTLPQNSPLMALWNHVDDIRTAIQMQEDFEALLYFAKNPDPALLIDLLFHTDTPCMPKASAAAKEAALEALRENSSEAMPRWRRLESLLKDVPQNADKLFAIDMSRIAVYGPAFTDELIAQVGAMKLSQYRNLTQSLQRADKTVRAACQNIFHRTAFRAWRDQFQKEFLAQKRAEEKEKKTYARPYIDYLDQKERELFDEFFQSIRLPLLVALLQQNPALLPDEMQCYFDPTLYELTDWEPLRYAKVSEDQWVQWLKTMRSYRELQRPLYGSYRYLRGQKGQQTEKDLAAAFYPIGGFGFSRCHAFQSAAPMGSIFKLVTAYAAMRQHSDSRPPLVLFDEVGIDNHDRSLIVASTLDHKPYHRHYKGGRLPRSHLPQLGIVDLIGAIEQSSNPYFAILAGDYLSQPEDLTKAAADFGLGNRTGIDLPAELKGRLPTDIETNRTGLYSFAIGQHTLVTTPLQVAVMMEAIANGGHLIQPKLVRSIEGIPAPAALSQTHLAEEDLSLLGIDFPLFSPSSHSIEPRQSAAAKTRIERTIALPNALRNTLCEGLDRVVWGSKGSARPSCIKSLAAHPSLMRDFLSLQHQMIGKTSTAEISCRHDCCPSAASHVYKHIWFGAIAFPPMDSHPASKWENPELVVIVYLRYGDGGKEAAPLAAQVIHKWREIQNRR